MNDADDTTRNEERLVWTVEEAARLLGISRAHAYELVARGELPHLRLGRRVVVPKHAIEALLARVTT
ncbi:MAG: helix-turn-helix domain-containing protein [Acidimicrobiia bacterium]